MRRFDDPRLEAAAARPPVGWPVRARSAPSPWGLRCPASRAARGPRITRCARATRTICASQWVDALLRRARHAPEKALEPCATPVLTADRPHQPAHRRLCGTCGGLPRGTGGVRRLSRLADGWSERPCRTAGLRHPRQRWRRGRHCSVSGHSLAVAQLTQPARSLSGGITGTTGCTSCGSCLSRAATITLRVCGPRSEHQRS